MTLGEFIKQYRKEHGSLSQREFSEKCGLSHGYISMLEKGVNPNTKKKYIPSVQTLKAVAKAMGIPLNDLMQSVDENTEISLSAEPTHETSFALSEHEREDYLKKLINQKGYNIKSFAEKIGMPYSTLLTMLKNNIGGASFDNVIMVCKGLGITVEQLQNSNDNSNDIMYYLDLESMCERMKEEKRKKGLTNQELSDLSGVPIGTLAKILGNETKDPKVSSVMNIAKALGVSADYLVFGNVEKGDENMSRESIAAALKRLRKKSGLKADEVGALIGKSGKTVNAWENNHGQPDADALIQLCDIYNVSDILEEFRDEPTHETSFALSEHEKAVITAYRAQPDMQPAVDRLLGVDDTDYSAIGQDIADEIKKELSKTATRKFTSD